MDWNKHGYVELSLKNPRQVFKVLYFLWLIQPTLLDYVFSVSWLKIILLIIRQGSRPGTCFPLARGYFQIQRQRIWPLHISVKPANFYQWVIKYTPLVIGYGRKNRRPYLLFWNLYHDLVPLTLHCHLPFIQEHTRPFCAQPILWRQGDYKERCRLSWLTNRILVNKPKCGGGGGVAGSHPMSPAVHRSPNKPWISNAILKGTVSRDFLLLVFFMNQFPQAPEYLIRTVSNLFENSRRYLQLNVDHRCRWHRWQMKKIFNLKNCNSFVRTPLDSRVNIYINFCLQVHFKVSAAWY